jgi:hypothetical protein
MEPSSCPWLMLMESTPESPDVPSNYTQLHAGRFAMADDSIADLVRFKSHELPQLSAWPHDPRDRFAGIHGPALLQPGIDGAGPSNPTSATPVPAQIVSDG